MQKNDDVYETFDEIFNQCYIICNPVGNFRLPQDVRLNPTVILSLNFLLEVVKSFDSNLEKEHFTLHWNKFTRYLYNELYNSCIRDLDDHKSKVIFEIGYRLHDDFNEFKKGQGLQNFLEEKYEIFLNEAKNSKKNWEKNNGSPKKNYTCYDSEFFNMDNEIMN